ncbi:MAG: hypothetical protein LBC68_11610 [Prevotellaceae bacterium]|nr:hypothetical protein [Prevotellaceae bacterium]
MKRIKNNKSNKPLFLPLLWRGAEGEVKNRIASCMSRELPTMFLALTIFRAKHTQ